jgi:sugar-specific transcriptional regulator TrmB
MSKLMELGLVEKIIDTPIRFKPISLSEAISILLDRKKRADAQIQEEANRMIAESSVSDVEEVLNREEPKTFLTSPGDHLAKLLREKVTDLKKSYDVVTFLDEFDGNISSQFRTYKRLSAQGVKIRLIVENLSGQQYSSKLLEKLQENPNFEVKFVRIGIPACLGIYDEREVRISVEKRSDICDSPAYWSNNPVFVALLKSYFEIIWSQCAKSE